MNSSGIKRGLATTAVSALAIAGLPLFASSASAATGDSITVASIGPVRDGGDQGAMILLRTKDIVAGDLRLAATNLTDQADSLTQEVAIVGTETASAGDFTDSNATDGLDEIRVYVTVDSGSATGGTNYAFALYEDEDNGQLPDPAALTGDQDPDRDNTEAFGQVSGITAGTPTRIAFSPSLQSTPVNTLSDEYTGTLQDAAGRTTQLTGTDEEIRLSEVSGPGSVTFVPAGDVTPLEASDVGADGKFDFAARSDTQGLHVLRAGVYANDNVDPAVTPESFGANVNLDVSGTPAAAESIDPTEFNLVTGADDRDGYDQTSTSASVRQDQNVVTVEIKDASQANRIVTLTATSASAPNAVTFGGEATQTRMVTLNAQGVGSLTFTVDAGTIQTGDIFRIDGPALDNTNAADVFPANGFTVNYTGAALAAGDVDADQTVYFSSFGGTVNPVVTVVDQYGDPVTNAFVTYEITSGPNDTNTESARVQTDENGQVTFSITDTKATATNQADGALTFRVYPDAFDPNEVLTDTSSRIDYSADGTGADFLVSVDGQVPGGAVYNPTINPLTDAVADNAAAPAGDSTDEDATVAIAGGTTGAPVTVTVDNGGLILDGGNTLADGVSSDTRTAAQTFEIVGTTAGTVNITVTSGGKTQTATLEVETLEDNSATARNVELEGPEGAVAGDVVDFTATVSDAFGNPVTGFDGDDFDVRLTGPANEQGNSGDSDENGEIAFGVEITQGASNPVTLRLQGEGAQFGADEDRRTAAAMTDNAPGLSASNDVATATVEVTDIEALEQALADAQAVLADRQAELAAASADLDVAQAQLAIAQAEVDRLQERKQNLRQKLNKAKRNDNRQKAKTTRKKLRAVKRQLDDARNAVVVAQTRVDGQQTVVDLREQAVTEAEEAVAQAQADLDEAQN